MISIRIWQAILRPFVAHPLFQRAGVWTPPTPLNNRWERFRQWLIKHELKFFWGLVVLFVVAVLIFGFWQTLLMVIFAPMAIALLLLPFGLLFLGNIYGLMSAFTISATIVNEKVQGRYTLIGLTPYGFEGATWAFCSLVVHANNGLRRVRLFGRVLYTMLITIVAISFINVAVLASLSDSAYLQGIWRDLLTVLVISVILGIEFVQSASVGAILGMLMPAYSMTRFENRNRTLSLFIAVQFGSYLAVALVYLFFVLPLLLLLGWTHLILLSIGFGVTFYIIRELVVIALWRMLAQSLMADLKDLDQLTHVGIQEHWVVVRATDVMVRFVFMRRARA